MKRYLTLAAIVLALVAVLVTIGYCSRGDAVRKAKAGESVAEGRTVSAVEAINEIGKLGERADATDQQVQKAQEAVRNARPEDRNAEFRYRTCILQQRTDCAGLQPTR
jgi:hypothetical protein